MTRFWAISDKWDRNVSAEKEKSTVLGSWMFWEKLSKKAIKSFVYNVVLLLFIFWDKRATDRDVWSAYIIIMMEPGLTSYYRFSSGLWSRSRNNFGWLKPELKNFEWWSRKFEIPSTRHSSCNKPMVQTMQWFSVFNGPNRSGAGAKNAPQPWFVWTLRKDLHNFKSVLSRASIAK